MQIADGQSFEDDFFLAGPSGQIALQLLLNRPDHAGLGFHQIILEIDKALIPTKAVGLLKMGARLGKVASSPAGAGHEKLHLAAIGPALRTILEMLLGRGEVIAVESLPG